MIDQIVSEIRDPRERYETAAAIQADLRRRARMAQSHAETMKRCPRCQETKPLSAFGPNAARADGVQSFCRACR